MHQSICSYERVGQASASIGVLLLILSSPARSFSALTLWNKGWRGRTLVPGLMIVCPADLHGRLAFPVKLRQIFMEAEGRKGWRSIARLATIWIETPRVSPAACTSVLYRRHGSCSLRYLFPSLASSTTCSRPSFNLKSPSLSSTFGRLELSVARIFACCSLFTEYFGTFPS